MYPSLKIFAGPRGSGRTTALVNWCRNFPWMDQRPPRQFVRLIVLDEYRKHQIENVFGNEVRVWTLDRLKGGWKSYVQLAVDDFDQTLHQSFVPFERQIRAVSILSEDYLNIPRPESLKPIPQVELELNTILNKTQH